MIQGPARKFRPHVGLRSAILEARSDRASGGSEKRLLARDGLWDRDRSLPSDRVAGVALGGDAGIQRGLWAHQKLEPVSVEDEKSSLLYARVALPETGISISLEAALGALARWPRGWARTVGAEERAVPLDCLIIGLAATGHDLPPTLAELLAWARTELYPATRTRPDDLITSWPLISPSDRADRRP